MKRLLSGILVLTLLFSILSLSSCANTNEEKGNTENSADEVNQGVTEEATTDIEEVVYSVPDSNFNGEEFHFLTRMETTPYWNDLDFQAEEETGEAFNDAVYKRNRIVEDKLNITITETHITDVIGSARKAIRAGDDVYDVVVTQSQNAGVLAADGLLIDLYQIPNLDLSARWWDQNFNSSMSIMKKLYFSCGDINTVDNEATWCVFFNKVMESNLGLDNHYELVRSGKWTIDQMHRYAVEATKDLNGDGVLDPTDQWGMVNQYECMMAMLMGSGKTITTKNADDIPELSMNNESSINILTRIHDWLNDKAAQIKADDYYGKYTDVWTEVNVGCFIQDRALYYMGPMTTVHMFRAMDSSFGIIPLPKYDEAQTEYYSPIQYNNASVITVPVTNMDLERTGIVLTSMAAESINTVTRAYYDVTLKRKLARDNDSSEMLDMIFGNRIYDIGFTYNWGALQSFYENLVKKTPLDFTSQYEKNEPKIIKAMEKTIEEFNK